MAMDRGVTLPKVLTLFFSAQISSLLLSFPLCLPNPPFARTSFEHNCFHTWKAHWSHSRWPLQRQKPQWYDLSGVRAQKLGRVPSLTIPCGQLQNTICFPKPPLPFLIRGGASSRTILYWSCPLSRKISFKTPELLLQKSGLVCTWEDLFPMKSRDLET